jgi:hypothetical protein
MLQENLSIRMDKLLSDVLKDTSNCALLKKVYSLVIDSQFIATCSKENNRAYIQRNMFAGTCFDFYRNQNDPLFKVDSIYKFDISEYDSIRIHFFNTPEDHQRKFLKVQFKLWIPGYTNPQDPESHTIWQTEIDVPAAAGNILITKSINRDFRIPDYRIGKMPQVNSSEVDSIFGFNLQSGSPAECDSTRIFKIANIKLIEKENYKILSLSLGKYSFILRRYEAAFLCLLTSFILMLIPVMANVLLKKLVKAKSIGREINPGPTKPNNDSSQPTEPSQIPIHDLLNRRTKQVNTWQKCKEAMVIYEKIYNKKLGRIGNTVMGEIIGIKGSDNFANTFKLYVPCSPLEYQGLCYVKSVIMDNKGICDEVLIKNIREKFSDKYKDNFKNTFSNRHKINELFLKVENITLDEFSIFANSIISFENQFKNELKNSVSTSVDENLNDLFGRYKYQSITLAKYKWIILAKLILEKNPEETPENLFDSLKTRLCSEKELIDSPRELNDVFQKVEAVDLNDFCLAMKAKRVDETAINVLNAFKIADILHYDNPEKLRKIFMIVTGKDLRV